MLILNLHGMLHSRGIARPQSYLVANGFTNHTAHRLLNNKIAPITYRSLEKLCLLCNCTPDDLFAWVPDETKPVDKDHPMHEIKLKAKVINPVERMKKLPVKKLQELEAFMDKLERGE